MPSLADHITEVPPSGVRAIFNTALAMSAAGERVTHLAVGEPDLAPEPHVVEAARAAWARGEVRYAPNGGLPALREHLARVTTAQRGTEVTPDQIWVTIGGTQALYLAFTLVLGRRDKVLVPDPGYTTFTMAPAALGARPVPYPLRPERGFAPSLADIAPLLTRRTRAIVVNSPSNPLGTVLSRGRLQQIVDIASASDLWIISDEVYSGLVHDGEHVSIASLPGAEGRVLSVHSVSKTYALTGARVGYLVTPPGWSDVLNAVQEAMVSCVAPPDQHAALAALTGPQEGVARARAHYAENLRLATGLLAERGFEWLPPKGGFYVWVDVRERVAASGLGSVAAWARELLVQRRVSVAPGSAFGASGEGWARLCVAASPEAITTGIDALATF